MYEQAFWHFSAIAIYSLTFWRLRLGLKDSTSWFCLFFAFGFSGNILGYPLALMDNLVFNWLLDSPSTILHGKILLFSMIATWAAHLAVRKKLYYSSTLRSLPEFRLAGTKVFRVLTIVGALGSIVLSLSGYYGYFVAPEYLITPPGWLGITTILMSISSGLLFILIFRDFQRHNRVSVLTAGFIALWLIAGFLSGFKTQVLIPGLFVAISAWACGRLKLRHVVVLMSLIVLAYSVVEPMREAKWRGAATSSGESLGQVVGSDELTTMELGIVTERFSQRVDYTRTAVKTLSAYEAGRLRWFKSRLDEYFLLLVPIALLPRSFWPNKPLSNLGGVLSQELDGRVGSSITPSRIVMTYIWGGWFGLAFNALLWGVFLTIGGQIVMNTKSSLYEFSPFIVLALVMSLPAAMMASYYIDVIRMCGVLLVLYQLPGVKRSHRQFVNQLSPAPTGRILDKRQRARGRG